MSAIPAQLELKSIIAQLEEVHGQLKAPNLKGPLEMILWENVVYLEPVMDFLGREFGA